MQPFWVNFRSMTSRNQVTRAFNRQIDDDSTCSRLSGNTSMTPKKNLIFSVRDFVGKMTKVTMTI